MLPGKSSHLEAFLCVSGAPGGGWGGLVMVAAISRSAPPRSPRLSAHTSLPAQYPEAAVLAPVCAHDGELTPEERRVFDSLELANFDSHPDAHAVRLHISLAARATSTAELCTWNVAAELHSYVHKYAHVSSACRLPLRGELELLRSVELPTQRLLYRATLVQAVLAIDKTAEGDLGGYLMPAPPMIEPDALVTRGAFFDVYATADKELKESEKFAYAPQPLCSTACPQAVSVTASRVANVPRSF